MHAPKLTLRRVTGFLSNMPITNSANPPGLDSSDVQRYRGLLSMICALILSLSSSLSPNMKGCGFFKSLRRRMPRDHTSLACGSYLVSLRFSRFFRSSIVS